MTLKRLLKRGLIATAVYHGNNDIDMYSLKDIVDGLEHMPFHLLLENSIAFEKWFDIVRTNNN